MQFFWTYLCTALLLFVGVLLMFIVLLQRGRGGGLAGAFGGLGGQSAFGTKAGDVFTKITVVLATIWVVLAGVTGYAMRHDRLQGFKEAKKPPEVSAEPEKNDPSKKPIFNPDPKKEKPEDNKLEPPKTDPPKKEDKSNKKEKSKKDNTKEKPKQNKKDPPKPDPKKKKKD